MTYSLWRNGELLGELEVRPHPRAPEQISGILRPTPALAERESIWQTRSRIPPMEMVQRRKPPQVLGAHRGNTGSDMSKGVFVVREGDTRPSRDVSPKDRLEVRSADGTPIVADVILHCWILPEGEEKRAEIMRLHGTLGDGRHLWSFILRPRA